MYLLINNRYLKKIKNLLINILYSSRNKFLSINVTEDSLTFNYKSELFSLRFELPNKEGLIIKKPGEAVIDIKTLDTIIDCLNRNNDLEIYKADKNYLQFFSGNYNCDLFLVDTTEENIQNKLDFDLSNKKRISIPYSILSKACNRLKDFCKTSERNITKSTVLTNIHFYKQKDIDILETWASDSYRAVFGEFEYKSTEEFKLNIQPTILTSILGLCSEYSDEDLEFYLDELNETSSELLVKKNEYLIKLKLDNSEFPQLIKWFNLSANMSFSVNKKELLNAIDRTSIFSAEKDTRNTIYRTNENFLYLEYKDNQKGSCSETVEVDVSNYKEIELSLNNMLLKSLIKQINSEIITFKIHDSLKPIVILPYDEFDNFKQFIIPSGRT